MRRLRGLSEQQRIVAGGCYPPAHKPGWIYVVIVLLVLALVLLEVLAQRFW